MSHANLLWTQRLWSILVCATIGLAMGVIWAFMIGPVADGPPSLSLSLYLYAGGLTFSGILVGTIQRLPGCVGAGAGGITLAILAVIVGPRDGWIVMWIIYFGGSGMIGGAIIGGFFHLIQKGKQKGKGDGGKEKGTA